MDTLAAQPNVASDGRNMAPNATGYATGADYDSTLLKRRQAVEDGPNGSTSYKQVDGEEKEKKKKYKTREVGDSLGLIRSSIKIDP